jgi:hypothetical protein
MVCLNRSVNGTRKQTKQKIQINQLLVKPEILTSYIYISYPVAQLCVNTLLTTKVTLITDGISVR